MATDPHRQEQRTKRGYGSIEDGVKIVNYEDSEVSASAQHAQSTSSAPPFSTNRWLQFGSFCAGLVLVASLVGHRAILAAHVVKVSGIKEAGGGGGVTTGGGGEPNLFLNQMVDHFDPTNNATWSHPYFVSGTHFAGPGHPILVILGGEGPVTNILYPFVSTKLAKEFGAYVLQTEHRFYGNSQPVGFNATNHELDLYLAPEQALADWIRIIRHVQVKLGCSLHNKTSSSYCPVITIGGSYPGFLSAMMRLNYPSVVDIGYASSAPLKLYEHSPNFDADGYYDFVTKVRTASWGGRWSGKITQELHLSLPCLGVRLRKKHLQAVPTVSSPLWRPFMTMSCKVRKLPPSLRWNSVFASTVSPSTLCPMIFLHKSSPCW